MSDSARSPVYNITMDLLVCDNHTQEDDYMNDNVSFPFPIKSVYMQPDNSTLAYESILRKQGTGFLGYALLWDQVERQETEIESILQDALKAKASQDQFFPP